MMASTHIYRPDDFKDCKQKQQEIPKSGREQRRERRKNNRKKKKP